MRTLVLASALLLAGCLTKPNNTDLCFESNLRFNDVCEFDIDGDAEDALLQSCEFTAGEAIAHGCATELRAALKCAEKATEGVDCDDFFDEVNKLCSFEQGKVEGCNNR